MKHAGLISMGAYSPGKEVSAGKINQLTDFLRDKTQLHKEYIDEIEKKGHLPGRIETNYEGWESQQWYQTWLDKLPSKFKAEPFRGTKHRRRVPMDPVSVKKSLIPHPMLSSDAEALAGALAIFNANLQVDDIDLVIVSSLVPDRPVPLNASLVQHKIGLKNAGAYNVDTCCSSFITMSEIAMTYVRAGIKKKVLIIVSSIDSHINDKSTYFSVDTGDGAVAAVVSEVEKGYGYINSHSTSKGNRHAAIVFHKRKPELLVTSSQGANHEQEFVTFNDKELCKEIGRNAQKDMLEVVRQTLKKSDLTVSDIDFLCTHQPVNWAANAWREAIGVPPEKFYESFKSHGNIACASVPTNLIEAVEKGFIKQGDKVMICSSGVGENHIALMQKISPQLIKNNRLISLS